jgi:predicted transcriptional regulator
MAMIKKTHFSIRVEPALLKRLKREADLQGVSASSLARKAVKFYVEGEAGYNRRTAR